MRNKLYEAAWEIQFGDDDKVDKLEDARTVVSHIKKYFSNIKDLGGEEITSDKGRLLSNFSKNIK